MYIQLIFHEGIRRRNKNPLGLCSVCSGEMPHDAGSSSCYGYREAQGKRSCHWPSCSDQHHFSLISGKVAGQDLSLKNCCGMESSGLPRHWRDTEEPWAAVGVTSYTAWALAAARDMLPGAIGSKGTLTMFLVADTRGHLESICHPVPFNFGI